MKKHFLFFIGCITLTFNAWAWNTPTYDSPSNGSNVWTGLWLDWDPVSSSEGYQIQLDTSPNFNSPLMLMHQEVYINANSNNTDTEEWFEDLFFGQTYYWRVRAYVTNDTSAWSTPINFATRDYTPLDFPGSQTNQWTGIMFDWDPHVGVDQYEFQLDSSAAFNSPILVTHSENYINGNSINTDTEEWFDDLFFGKTYHWRVRAINAVDTSEWRTRTFNTRDYVPLDFPGNQTNQWTGLMFDWDPHVGVDQYEFQLDSSASFNSPILVSHSENYINGNSINADTEEWFEDMYFGQTYHWRVRAINAVDTSEWRTRTFDTRDYVNLDSPNSGATNISTVGVGLDWDAHPGVDFYEVQWDSTNLYNSSVHQNHVDNYINGLSNNADTYENSGALETNTVYHWRVRAINAVDTSEWRSRHFSTGSTITAPGTPNLITPADQSQGVSTPVFLDWSDVANAQSYEIWYSTVPNFNTYSVSTSSISEFSNLNLAANAVFYWKVRAKNGGFYSDWSTVFSFDTFTCSPTTQTETISTCQPYTWTDGTTYSNSGQYTQNLTSVGGCDSTVILDLTISNIDLAISINNQFIEANNTNADAYQWINCSSNTPISGATQNSFSPNQNGDYAVIITENNCSDTSACITFSTSGLEQFEHNLVLYPNPVKESVSIKSFEKIASIQIYSHSGHLVKQGFASKNIDISELSNGLYLVEIKTVEGNIIIRKMVKQ